MSKADLLRRQELPFEIRMVDLKELTSREDVQAEYRKSLLLNMFKKMVVRMNRDEHYRTHVRKLFLQSTDENVTTRVLMSQTYNYELTIEDAMLVRTWFDAYLKKSNKRKPFTQEFKLSLYHKQNGMCMVCGEPLGSNMSKVHVDHIIPWMLVGDELRDNYQCLCETCNECKSAQTDYIFKNLLKLN